MTRKLESKAHQFVGTEERLNGSLLTFEEIRVRNMKNNLKNLIQIQMFYHSRALEVRRRCFFHHDDWLTFCVCVQTLGQALESVAEIDSRKEQKTLEREIEQYNYGEPEDYKKAKVKRAEEAKEYLEEHKEESSPPASHVTV